MQFPHKPVTHSIRLLFLTVLMLTLGFAFASQLSQHKSYLDDTTRLLAVELQEVSADTDPSSQLDDASAALLPDHNLQSNSLLNAHHLFFCERSPRLTFLYQIRPRSPPQHQIS